MDNKRPYRSLKRGLFIFIVLLLFLPLLQQVFQFAELKELNGAFTEREQPKFTIEDWLEGDFQEKEDQYLNENIGFRNFLVRLYNQLQFSLYKKARAKGVIVGKENYLYEEGYILAPLGLDFIGKDSVAFKVNELNKLDSILKTKAIDLIIVLAPGKGSFFPEYIPERYKSKKRISTNYKEYRKQILATDIHLLDINGWFRSIKGTTPYPLYPKTGTHWSLYGEALVADTLTKFINSIKTEKKVLNVVIESVETSKEMRDTDDDIEKGMNLLFDVQDFEMGYPQYSFKRDSSITKAKVLTVGDSYYWGLYARGLSKEAFNEGQFWYYNKEVYPDNFYLRTRVQEINMVKEVEKHDVVVLLFTDANLDEFPFGFGEQLYKSYVDPNYILRNIKSKEELRAERVLYFIEVIKATPNWFESVQEKALEKNVPIEEELRKNAEYMVAKEESEKEFLDQ